MEEKTWVISKKGERNTAIEIIVAGIVLSFSIIFYLDGLTFDVQDIYLIGSLITVGLSVYFFIKYLSSWGVPKTIKIDNDIVMREEKFPDGYIKRFVIPMDGIYRITMKKRKAIIEYKLPDGREFIWRFIRPGYAREDRKKLEEVLEEILKRIDKNKVEIVRKG